MTIHSVVIQKLLSTNAHLGRRVAAHHFKIYTYGSRNAMTIIDSDKTLICLRNACQFIANLVRQKGRFLFVNTNTLFDEIVYQMTQKIGCASDTSWRLGGFLTNSGSPKKFRSRNKKLHLGSIQPPDCVVIMDTQRKSSVIFEADKLQIPIVGLVDSSMPWDIYKRITYPVPANDSVQFVYLFCNLITKTFLLEQKRFAAALGATKRDEQLSHPMTDTGDVSENIKQSKTSIGNNEIFVIPYESLGLTSDDPLETKELLDKLVVLKLNGGLGTKMGFNGPKCAIEVCNGLTYLDLIVNQIESLNSKHGCNVPLILMNTIRTHDSTLKAVEKYSKKTVDILTLCQNQSYPVNKRQDSEDEMYHFDQQRLFLSLKNTGTLDALLLQGKEYILVVKSDNLGTVVDSKILNHLVQNRIQYCMEVTPNISPDFKGGILSSYEGKFQSAEKFRLCDTSNLWVNLKAIKRLIETDALNMENYPVSKKVNNDEIRLQETEASSAIRFFDRAIGVTVPQSCFQPMTRTSDLLVVQSDLYTYTEGVLTRNSARTNLADPSIELGPEFEKLSDFQSRFKSIPSIIELDSLKVMGDVWFGTGIILKGKVTIVAKPGTKLEIPDGAVIENKEISDPRDI
ncbi:UTP--glucose-1-phosphate uridylyltransferase-like isoform X2 [Camellia sinensis]|uniref:UTP--glucose-1-phosphate uridylyltransferase-like isoform X2 n=1 Tax=Camellia sinensis TaxID=4442 RepID=UPI0010366AB1|nr:UTP--glucose-1-phosphate uridylyltransferase-like isoform X2 [Camellia sinensis]